MFINALKKFLEAKFVTRFTEKGDELLSKISDQINFDDIYVAIVSFIKETGYSAEEISVGDNSDDQRVELKVWKESIVFRLKIYYAGNDMAIHFF